MLVILLLIDSCYFFTGSCKRPANGGSRRYPTIIPCERPRLAWPWMNLSMTGQVMRRPP
jgi:hypothetical protein